MKIKIEDAHRKNEMITKKLIQVYGKFEEYLSQVNGARGIYKAEHEALNEKYQNQIDQIYDPSQGLLKKLRDLQNRIRIGQKLTQEQDVSQMKVKLEAQGQGSSLTSATSFRENEQVSDDDLRDLFSVLKGQKEGMEVLQNNINKNANTLYAIERELNNI